MTLFHTYIFIETSFEKLHFFSTYYGQGLTLLKIHFSVSFECMKDVSFFHKVSNLGILDKKVDKNCIAKGESKMQF